MTPKRAALLATLAVALCGGGCSMPKLPSLGSAEVDAPSANVVTAPLPLGSAVSADPAAVPERTATATCRSDERAKRRMRSLVVTLTAEFEYSAAEVGTGLLVGHDAEGLYVLTAHHVVNRAMQTLKSVRAELADGTEVRAGLAPRQPRRDPPFSDIALLLLPARDLQRSTTASSLDWEALPHFAQRSGEQQLSIAGNPAGRGFTQTAPSKSEVTGDTISITQSAEGGMSGGGIFDEQNILVGLAHSDNGRFALGYPIAPLLALVSSAGAPVSLRPSQLTPPNVYLTSVFGQPKQLRQAVGQELAAALDARGLESGCLRSGSYRLSVGVQAIYPAGARSVARLAPELIAPNGGKLTVGADDSSLHHLPLTSPFDDVDKLRVRMREGVDRVIDSAVSQINQGLH